METNLNTRVVGKTLGDRKGPPQEAIPVVLPRRVPAIICPGCGRGMTPRVERWRSNNTADCVCTLSNCKFIYTPPTTQMK